MSKTVMEVFKDFPEPYRTQAIENTDYFMLESIFDYPAFIVLEGAFRWDDSPQGHKYWQEFHDSLETEYDNSLSPHGGQT